MTVLGEEILAVVDLGDVELPPNGGLVKFDVGCVSMDFLFQGRQPVCPIYVYELPTKDYPHRRRVASVCPVTVVDHGEVGYTGFDTGVDSQRQVGSVERMDVVGGCSGDLFADDYAACGVHFRYPDTTY